MTAVLLVNLGSPEAPKASAIRKFLRNFLADRRVVELPALLWYPILYGVILPFRPRRLVSLYKSIFHGEKSPLIMHLQEQTELLETRLVEDNIKVDFAVCYGKPTIADQLTKYVAEGEEHILVIPMYPQYSATTTGAVQDQIARWIINQRNIPEIRIVKDYHKLPEYIFALKQSITKFWQSNPRHTRLLMSFHGIPERCVKEGDPYYAQCCHTAELLANSLDLSVEQWQIAFQSRFGFARWLEPSTTFIIKQWAQSDPYDATVICPAFSSDCLETLEEIAQQGKDLFISEGGKHYQYIPCLNSETEHIDMLVALVKKYTQGW